MAGIITAAAIGAGASLYGSRQARKAGDAQANAAREGQAANERMFNRQNELNEPFRQAGITGQNRYMELMGLGGNTGAEGFGKYSRDFGMSDFEKDPGYEFRLSEGLKGLDRSAAARGGMISGAALKAAGRYGQDYASNEYSNAFNRYQINRSNQLNPLAALAGMGQTATGAMSNAAGDFGARSAASAMDIGNAQAAGRMGSANALMGGVGQGMNFYQNNRLMDMYSRRGAPTSTFRASWDNPGVE
jgi:hypothetical protein